MWLVYNLAYVRLAVSLGLFQKHTTPTGTSVYIIHELHNCQLEGRLSSLLLTSAHLQLTVQLVIYGVIRDLSKNFWKRSLLPYFWLFCSSKGIPNKALKNYMMNVPEFWNKKGSLLRRHRSLFEGLSALERSLMATKPWTLKCTVDLSCQCQWHCFNRFQSAG